MVDRQTKRNSNCIDQQHDMSTSSQALLQGILGQTKAKRITISQRAKEQTGNSQISPIVSSVMSTISTTSAILAPRSKHMKYGGARHWQSFLRSSDRTQGSLGSGFGLYGGGGSLKGGTAEVFMLSENG